MGVGNDDVDGRCPQTSWTCKFCLEVFTTASFPEGVYVQHRDCLLSEWSSTGQAKARLVIDNCKSAL